jgi:multiple sugar transport system ATP-binding protein
MVFQSYALYPHMTVYDNMAFGLQTAGENKAVIDQRVQAAARLLKIEDYLKRKPKALSGGQRQRVAIGRAIVRQPRLFLFDEPLSNLDAELRVQMRVELSKLHADLGTTMIYVTHDQVEAMTMADRIVVLRDGRVEQAGSPLTLYNRPVNRFVAGFIGSPKMNFLDVRVADRSGESVTLDVASGLGLTLPVPAPMRAEDRTLVLGIRPEHVVLADTGLPMRVSLTEQLGGNTVLYGTIGADVPLVVQVVGQSLIRRGELVRLTLPPEHCHLFDATGACLTNGAGS